MPREQQVSHDSSDKITLVAQGVDKRMGNRLAHIGPQGCLITTNDLVHLLTLPEELQRGHRLDAAVGCKRTTLIDIHLVETDLVA